MLERVNHLAAWVSGVVYFLLGWLWYTVFGTLWIEQLHLVPGDLHPSIGRYVGTFLLGMVLSYGTAIALTRRPEDQTAAHGVRFALLMGISLFATQTLTQTLYEERPIGLWLIDVGFVSVGFVLIGAIVGGWRKPGAAPTK